MSPSVWVTFLPSVMVMARPAGDDALEGGKADEGVSADLFAVLDRLQQEALALRPGGAQKGGDRRFEVGGQGAADGDEVCSLASARNSLRVGWTGWAGAFTDPSVTGAEGQEGAGRHPCARAIAFGKALIEIWKRS